MGKHSKNAAKRKMQGTRSRTLPADAVAFGIDLGDSTSNICVVDADGEIENGGSARARRSCVPPAGRRIEGSHPPRLSPRVAAPRAAYRGVAPASIRARCALLGVTAVARRNSSSAPWSAHRGCGDRGERLSERRGP